MIADKKHVKGTALFASTFLAVLLILATAGFSKEKNSPVLATYDVGPVITLSQCSSCHDNIDTFSNKDLKFDHWVHFKNGVNCATCHVEPAHKDGKTTLPPMESCFGCHGVQHSAQGLSASGDCATCHPAGFNKLPSDHTGKFKASEHKKITDLQLNNCMICHKKDDCKGCHEANKVKSDYSKYTYKAMFQPKSVAGMQSLTFEKVTTLGQCITCHKDIDANTPPGLIFDHWVHFQNGVSCSTCHKGLVHQKGRITRPTMNFCYSCHGMKHSRQGLVATEDCRKCHTASFNLKPPSHGASWMQNHKKTVKDEMFSCMTCHQKDFCRNCHTARKVMPPLITPKWKQTNSHEQAHVQKGKDCTICHSDAFCRKCHKTPMPHSYTWLGTHKTTVKANKRLKDDCYVCHKEKAFCNECHHAAKAAKLYIQHYESTELKLLNCIKCHPELKLSKEELVKRGERPFVYHMVHFEKKYVCEECHNKGLKGLKNETFELCKIEGCHPAGQKDPISGAKLCLSCHKKPHEN